MSYLLAIDQGTTGTTSLLIDASTLAIVDKEKQDYRQIYPQPGWVEHDLEDIWASVAGSVAAVLGRQSVDPSQILAIGIANQRETTCAYDTSGKPLHHAIVWQDRRTAAYCEEKGAEYEKRCRTKTGLCLDPYFAASKMRWLLDQVPAVQAAADTNNLCLSTVDTFLLHRLTGGSCFATEATNASRTMLMDLETLDWDADLLEFFGIPRECLPPIADSFTHFGTTRGCEFLPDGIPILCMLGDQQAALVGQACVNVGDVKATYGTGAFLVLNTGAERVHSGSGLLSTVAYAFQDTRAYALEGTAYIAGAAVQWLRDNLKCIRSAPEVETLARQVTDLAQMEHVLFMPFFTGVGTPHWNAEAKAAILGLTRGTDQTHIARACLEGIALSLNDAVASFRKDFSRLSPIRVDGGAAANDLLMQLQANFSEMDILRPQIIDTTGFGAAMGALVAMGEYRIGELGRAWQLERAFHPEGGPYYARKRALWDSTIRRLLY